MSVDLDGILFANTIRTKHVGEHGIHSHIAVRVRQLLHHRRYAG